MTFAEIISVAEKAKDLFAILESSDLASLLAEIEFAAAREAFERIPESADKASQVRICIGHLNSCYHGYVAALNQMTKLDRTVWARKEHFEAVRTKAIFVLCVRAVCHYYVGESRHWTEDLKLAQAMRSFDLETGGHPFLWLLSGAVINPLVFFDIVYMAYQNEGPRSRIYQLDDAAFESFKAFFSN
jgi:hypothetical protein